MYVRGCVTLASVGRVRGAERGRVRVVGLDTPYSAPRRCLLVEILAGRLEEMNYYNYIHLCVYRFSRVGCTRA